MNIKIDNYLHIPLCLRIIKSPIISLIENLMIWRWEVKRRIAATSTIFIFFAVFGLSLYANIQPDSLSVPGIRVYIDCGECDTDFIKQEIAFVNYVRFKEVADVYILITTQTTGSGGTEYTITYIGQHNYAGMKDTLKYISGKLDTYDTIRKGLVKVLKLGLIRYVAKTPMAKEISILYSKKEKPTEVKDRWNHWVFSLGINSFLSGEQSTKFNSINGSISANRTTEDWKTHFSVYHYYYNNEFKLDDSTTINSFSKSYGASVDIVKSINDHWSLGLWPNLYSSTYSNMKRVVSLSSGVEYNIFPYSQSTNRELRMSYSLGYDYYKYFEETIYNRTEDKLFNEAVSLSLDTKQKWGSINTTLRGSNYLYDFKKNRLTLSSNLSLQVIKGLSFTLFGRISWIHNQISIPKRGLTPEEVLLHLKQLSTQYNYFVSVGLSYSFGSIYSNIVNPRFGE